MIELLIYRAPVDEGRGTGSVDTNDAALEVFVESGAHVGPNSRKAVLRS